MFECEHCDLFFNEKRLFLNHQKTKKCLMHRNILFTCQKCFVNFKGYDQILNHTKDCDKKVTGNGVLEALLSQLSNHYKTTVVFNDNNTGGQINFTSQHNYVHPKKLIRGSTIPTKTYLFLKPSLKSDSEIIGSNNHYLNDIFNKILRLSDAFQLLSIKYKFDNLMDVLLPLNNFYLMDGTIYVLGKIQCENENGDKWFGDTFLMRENEKIVKCLWYKDPQLEQFFCVLKIILKDLLNLYLSLGNWIIKKEKVKLKGISDDIIQTLMDKYNLVNLVENIKILNSFETFSKTIKDKIKQTELYTNINNVFKDELLPLPISNEEFSLMLENNHDCSSGNYKYLMHYILPDFEKQMFTLKI
jgi:hypothetical protein